MNQICLYRGAIIILVGLFFVLRGCDSRVKSELKREKETLLDSVKILSKENKVIKGDISDSKEATKKATENYNNVLKSISKLETGLKSLQNENKNKVSDTRMLNDSATETLYRANVIRYSDL